MQLKVNSEQEYDAALVRIGELMSAAPTTPEFAELEVLVTLVETYEKEHYTIGLPQDSALPSET